MFNTKILLQIGLFAFAVLSSVNPALAETAAAPVPAPAAALAKIEPIKELSILDDKVGTGAVANPGKSVTVQYTGWLYTYNPAKPDHKGTKFDSSLDRGQPFTFQLGAGRVIKGWDQGVSGMKVGGKRTLTIPSDLAYGERGAGRGVIPKNAALIFEVELLDVH